jgi:N-formylglutamate amidohydrolase
MPADSIPGVLSITRPRTTAVPIVFDSPHSGSGYPADFDVIQPPAAFRRGEDSHVDALYAAAPDHGACLLAAEFSRVYVDPNRALDDLDPKLIDGEWPYPISPTDKSERGQGLVWRQAPPDLPLYDRLLSVAEVARRIDDYYRPYHRTLRDEFEALHDEHSVVFHVNCHSMPAMSTEMSPEGPGKERPQFTLGDRDGESCAPEFTNVVKETLLDMGYGVTVNDPYKGAELVRAFADPATGRHSLQIEINRSLYMDETTFERHEGFAELQGSLARLIEVIRSFAPKQAG